MKKNIFQGRKVIGIASLLFVLSGVVSAGFFGSELILPIDRVTDGDTIASHLDKHPPELRNISVRIRGVDTPESKKNIAKCDSEVELGKKAKVALKEWIGDSRTMTLKNIEWDKYGGRVVADVYVNNVSVTKWLLDNGFAKPYNGGTKSSWCN